MKKINRQKRLFLFQSRYQKPIKSEAILSKEVQDLAISEVNSSGHNIDPLSSNPKIPLKENAASFHVQKNYLSNSIIVKLRRGVKNKKITLPEYQLVSKGVEQARLTVIQFLKNEMTKIRMNDRQDDLFNDFSNESMIVEYT
uniref:Uncharacterized protein n=1 Tax=Cucumis melo TaxID=3656 RepID=A0A9I9E7Y2_CUCME